MISKEMINKLNDILEYWIKFKETCDSCIPNENIELIRETIKVLEIIESLPYVYREEIIHAITVYYGNKSEAVKVIKEWFKNDN